MIYSDTLASDIFSPVLDFLRQRAGLDAICVLEADLWSATLEPVSVVGRFDAAGRCHTLHITGEIAEKLAADRVGEIESILPLAWRQYPRRILRALRHEDIALGLFYAVRAGDREFSSPELRLVNQTAALLAAPLAAAFLRRELKEAREEVETMRQKLANRKIMERAKGILQARLGFTEEQAYLELRRLSRQSRVTMAEVASQIVAAPSRMTA